MIGAAEVQQEVVTGPPDRRPRRRAAARSRSAPAEEPTSQMMSDMVDLRELKRLAEEFAPNHPYRIVLLGEPDVIPREEYFVKMSGWFRLLKMKVE